MAEVIPAGITKEQLDSAIAAAIAGAGSGISSAQAQSLIDASIANRPTTTAMNSAISSATSGLATLSAVPTMATSAPPGVSDNGAAGAATMEFAGRFHTHASKARKQIVTMGAASSTYSWTYPVAFGAGVTPICSAIVQVPNGTTDLYNVQVMGTPSNTGCVFQINRVSAGLFGLLTGALGINTPVAATLHMIALEP